MTAWAQALLKSAAPMHSLHARLFDGRTIVGRIEWHTYQARTGKTFPDGIRGVSIYTQPEGAIS
jgi:hypothetical protein